mmetsp:Transcript_17060/g.23883  ORF Transcript_17060/g.23883 Transcript_17060/m.23883 type:complete len:91 (-) Transcript_17060:243-515(-)
MGVIKVTHHTTRAVLPLFIDHYNTNTSSSPKRFFVNKQVSQAVSHHPGILVNVDGIGPTSASNRKRDFKAANYGVEVVELKENSAGTLDL